MSSSDDVIVHAHLPGLLAVAHVLVLHRSPGLLLCLICEQGEPRLLSVQPLTLEEERHKRPLLQAFPACVPDALVLASIQRSTAEEAQDLLNTAWLQGETTWTASLSSRSSAEVLS